MAITPSVTQEARKLIQARGISTPTGMQIRTEAKRIDQERAVQLAKQNAQKTRETALAPKRTFNTVPMNPATTGFQNLVGRFQAQQPVTYTGQRILERGGLVQPGQEIPRINTGRSLNTPVSPAPQVPDRNIAPPPTNQLDQQALQILQNRQKYGLTNTGQRTAGMIATNFQDTAKLPGYENLTPDQAARLRQINDTGLQSFFGGLQGLSAENKAFEKKAKAAEEKLKDKLDTRRQNAINDFLSFRQKIVTEGGAPDAKAGAEFMQKLQTSDNPEAVLDQYYATAAPFVKSLFAPKRSGGTGSSISERKALKGLMSDYLGAVGDYFNRDEKSKQEYESDREAALADIDRHRAKIINDVGEDGLAEIMAEIDRLFPDTSKPVGKRLKKPPFSK